MNINQIEPFKDGQQVQLIAKVYQEAFGGEPWNEGTKCPVCESSYSTAAKIVYCPNCDLESMQIPVIEYWPLSQVLSDFYKEITKPGGICVVAQESSLCGIDLFGFAWGYDLTIDEVTEAKLEAVGLHNVAEGIFFYLDECAVVPGSQGRGLGKKLVQHIFEVQPHEQVLLRTLDNSRMCNLIKHMGGETILNISRDRVIMKLRVR